MTLYCEACKKNHHLTLGMVERIIYALQGDLTDTALIAKQPAAVADIDALETKPECLLSVHDGAGDIERYAEHVAGLVECRRERQKVAS